MRICALFNCPTCNLSDVLNKMSSDLFNTLVNSHILLTHMVIKIDRFNQTNFHNYLANDYKLRNAFKDLIKITNPITKYL